MNNYELIVSEFEPLARKVSFPRKSSLLKEGDICHQILFIEEGSLRSWFNDNGNDITFQFFFEGDFVSSFESLKHNQPSLYNIESITSVSLRSIQRSDFFDAIRQNPELKDAVNDHISSRLYHYQRLFISRIKNSPQQRYEELLQQNPEILERVPQHYIASYLGITPVSLSRIRNKK